MTDTQGSSATISHEKIVFKSCPSMASAKFLPSQFVLKRNKITVCLVNLAYLGASTRFLSSLFLITRNSRLLSVKSCLSEASAKFLPPLFVMDER